MEDLRLLRERVLARANAVFGLVGACLLIGGLFAGDSEGVWLGFVLATFTSLAAVGLGSMGMRVVDSNLGYALSVLAAGAFVGFKFTFIIGFVVISRGDLFSYGTLISVSLFGILMGLTYTLVFLPTMVALYAAVRRIGRARQDTAVDRADRALPWLIVGASLMTGCALVRHSTPHAIGVALTVVATASCILAAASASRIIAAWRYLRVAQRYFYDFPRRHAATARAVSDQDVDFGIGDSLFEGYEPASQPYRAQDRAVRSFRGEATVACRTISRLALGAALALPMCFMEWVYVALVL